MTLEEIKGKWDWIKHPEGGYFYPKYLSDESIPYGDNQAERPLYSSVYFLITNNEPSLFHSLQQDEIWHFYSGDPLSLHEITEHGQYRCTELGREEFQYLVPKNTWMAAECSGGKGYSLFGCSLSPGYDEAEFKMGERQKLISAFPQLESIIRRLTP